MSVVPAPGRLPDLQPPDILRRLPAVFGKGVYLLVRRLPRVNLPRPKVAVLCNNLPVEEVRPLRLRLDDGAVVAAELPDMRGRLAKLRPALDSIRLLVLEANSFSGLSFQSPRLAVESCETILSHGKSRQGFNRTGSLCPRNLLYVHYTAIKLDLQELIQFILKQTQIAFWALKSYCSVFLLLVTLTKDDLIHLVQTLLDRARQTRHGDLQIQADVDEVLVEAVVRLDAIQRVTFLPCDLFRSLRDEIIRRKEEDMRVRIVLNVCLDAVDIRLVLFLVEAAVHVDGLEEAVHVRDEVHDGTLRDVGKAVLREHAFGFCLRRKDRLLERGPDPCLHVLVVWRIRIQDLSDVLDARMDLHDLRMAFMEFLDECALAGAASTRKADTDS